MVQSCRVVCTKPGKRRVSLEAAFSGKGLYWLMRSRFHWQAVLFGILKNYPDMAKPALFWSIDVVCIVAYGDMTTWQREESYAVVCTADKDW